jgi:diaminohydroxyphosphoribosylaminopyrimidine deaminase/5-amino-6-(5-phosphoribosylamino)uracil reductase
MKTALTLARRGRGRTHPNPRVGAVVTDRTGAVVGRGYHRAAGLAHAEVAALTEAGALAHGGTLYVTLEPCRHTGRTPPCTDAIIAAGIRRVVIAIGDPHPLAGGGGDVLRAAGITVEWGDGEAEALEENLPFFSWVIRGRPWVQLKSAVSADGRMATPTGQSKYLTGAEARRDVHRLRNEADAVLVGSGTVLADDPELTCRGIRGGRDPVRVVLDSQGRLTGHERLFRTGSQAPTLIYTIDSTSISYERRLFQAGGEVVRVDARDGHVDLTAVLRDLGERDLLDILVEAGPRVQGGLRDAGCLDEWIAYWAPLLIGGSGSPGPVAGPGTGALEQATRLTRPKVTRFGNDWQYRALAARAWEELSNVLRHH